MYRFENERLKEVVDAVAKEIEQQLVNKFWEGWSVGDAVSVMIHIEDKVKDRGYVGSFEQIQKDIAEFVSTMKITSTDEENKQICPQCQSPFVPVADSLICGLCIEYNEQGARL